jgi:hypothetical protein
MRINIKPGDNYPTNPTINILLQNVNENNGKKCNVPYGRKLSFGRRGGKQKDRSME